MTLEQLVTDLATSQQLRDAGFPQDTALVWVEMPVGWVNGGGGVDYVAVGGYVNRVQSREITLGTLSERLCAAPTTEEILKELPSTIEITEGSVTAHYIQYIYHAAAGWAVSYCSTVPPVEYQCSDLQPILATSAAHAYLWWKKEVAG